MKEYTKLDKLKDFLWYTPIGKIEYYFAKRWLDKNFGVQEFWGDYLMSKIYPSDTYESKIKE